MNSDDRRSCDEDRFVRSSATRRVARLVDRGPDQRPGERHQQRRGDALAGDVGDDDARPAGPVAEREHVEEVAADLARRLVVGRDLEPAERPVASSGIRLRWIRRDSAISASRRWAGAAARHVLVGRARERRERRGEAQDDRLDERPVAASDDPPDHRLARSAADLVRRSRPGRRLGPRPPRR